MTSAPTLSPPLSLAPISAVTDLHCHILPDWDDGPRTLEEVFLMLDRAAASGIEIIVATPHVGRAFKGVEHDALEISGGVAKLQSEIEARGLDIQILPGAELMLGSVDLLSEQGILPQWTLGGKSKYALVESPFRSWPDFGNNLLYEMMLRGVQPIIAHPERYIDVQKDLKKMEEAVSQGALLQITAGSVAGQTSKEMHSCALKLLDAGLVHLIASDAHNSQHLWPGEVIDTVQKRIGEGRTRQIFEDNPRAIVASSPLPRQKSPEKPPSSGSLVSRIFGLRRR